MADPHAGFAAAVAFSQGTLQSLIRILYHAGQVPHRMTTPTPNTSPVDIDLFLDLPQMVFSAANQNQIQLDIVGWGSMTVRAGSTAETRDIRLTLRILVPPELSMSDGNLQFGFAADQATTPIRQIDVLSGGPWGPDAAAFLDSLPFALGFLQQVRDFLRGSGLLPSFDMRGLLGAIAPLAQMAAAGRVLDGAMSVGIDVRDMASGVVTTGNPDELTDVTKGHAVGVWQNVAALPLITKSMRDQVAAATSDAGATLDSLAITLLEGHFHVSGKASATGGSVSFSFDAVPQLYRPVVRTVIYEEYGEEFVTYSGGEHELWFQEQNVSVDVDLDWWAELLTGILALGTLGMAGLVVGSMVDMFRADTLSSIAANERSSTAAVQQITLAGTTGPPVQIGLSTFECHAVGIFAGVGVGALFPAPALEGWTFIPLERVPVDTIKYRLTLPFDVRDDDPFLHITWTIRRTDTNDIVFVDDGVDTEITLNHIRPVLLSASEFSVECHVYRTMGPDAVDLFSKVITLKVWDPLDRTHPFVRWKHDCYPPVVRVEANGSHTILGRAETHRRSKIHRTDFPGRCRMASHFSRHVFDADTPETNGLEYLDDLPFPRAALVANRGKLCDYCFFGGPTKTEPLI